MRDGNVENQPQKRGLFEAPPKTTFIIGFLSGLVICLIVGLILSFTVFHSNKASTNQKLADTGQKEVVGAQVKNTNAAAAQDGLSLTNIKKMAKDLGLDTNKFNNCLDSGEKAARVQADMDLGNQAKVRGTPATFINGYLISGALPYNDYQGQDGSTKKGFQSLIQDAIDGKPIESASNTEPFKFDISDSDHVNGDSNAKVTLVEFADFQCPFSSRHESTLKQILRTFSGKVRLVFKHYPLSFHQNAQKAAEAAECAADQGKFWEMHDLLFAAG